jgi:hypothetical protein
LGRYESVLCANRALELPAPVANAFDHSGENGVIDLRERFVP